MWHVATPAYGRDYKSGKEVKADWVAGKDFQMQLSGQYFTATDITKGDSVEIRFSKLTKLVVLKGLKS